MPSRPKPTPVTVSEVCSLCGMDWKLHGTEPTTETCIRLLAGEIALLRSQIASRPITYPVTYPAPYPVYPRPFYPWQRQFPYTVWNQANSGGMAQTPMYSNVTPRAITVQASC